MLVFNFPVLSHANTCQEFTSYFPTPLSSSYLYIYLFTPLIGANSSLKLKLHCAAWQKENTDRASCLFLSCYSVFASCVSLLDCMKKRKHLYEVRATEQETPKNTVQNTVKQNSKIVRRLRTERELLTGEEQHSCLTSILFTWAIPQHLLRLLSVCKEKLLVIQLNCFQGLLRKTKKYSFFLALSFYVTSNIFLS